MHVKIKSHEELYDIVSTIRSHTPSKKIVTTNGSFDLIHDGHIKSLEKAKEFGDILIVGLNSDSSIKQYKSIHRPIRPQDSRAYHIASFEVVDYVTIFDEPEIGIPLVKLIRPDYHVKSKSGYKGYEGTLEKEYGFKLILIEDLIGFSTTNLIKKIIEVERFEKNSKT